MKSSILKEIGKDVIYYIPAKLIPGLCGFFSIIAYTRLLSPAQYGIYILVLNAISMAINIGLGWIYNSILRYYEFYEKNNRLSQFISTTCASLFLIVPILIIGGLIVSFCFLKPLSNFLIFIATVIPTFIGKSFFSYVISILRAKRETLKYSIYSSFNSIGSVILSLFFLLFFRPSAESIFIGIALPSLFIVMIEIKNLYLNFHSASFSMFKKCFSYGFPLVGVAFGSMIISISDRYIIQYLKGSEYVGIYASGYDLVDKSIKIGFSILVAASYPIVVQQYEQKGSEEIKKILGHLLNIYVFVFAPIVLIFITLAPQIVNFFLGKAFKNASMIIPWIALGTFFLGITQILTQWLQIKQKTKILFILFSIAAGFNICTNFALIPKYNILGAAIATFVSYLFYSIFCLIECFPILITLPWWLMSKALVVLFIMYYSIKWLKHNALWSSLPFLLQLNIIGIFYIVLLALFLKKEI